MNLKINKSHLDNFILLGTVTVAGMSTVLRPSITSDITLFRLLLPFLIIYLFKKRFSAMMKVSLMSIILLIYSWFISENISSYSNFDWVFYLYYIIIIFWYYYTKYVVETISAQSVYFYLKYLFKIMIVLAIVQYIFGGTYPNTQERFPEIIIFFWNGNEFAAVLGAFIPLFFLKEKMDIRNCFWLICSFLIIINNDSRLVLLALLFFFSAFFVFKISFFKTKFLGLFAGGLIMGILILFLQDFTIKKGMVLGKMIIYPIKQIFLLEPVYNVGSINNRLNAIIYGTKELINSTFLGIGPGNSIPMMISHIVPGTEEFTAMSMHNFIYQIIVELGFLGLIYLVGIFIIVFKAIKRNFIYNQNLLWCYYFALVLCITSLSGPHSNYFFLFIFFYSIFHFKYNV